MSSTFLGCSYDNDPNYHLIGNLCVYFEAQKMATSSARTNCAGKFGNDHGRLFEPKSLTTYQSVYDVVKPLEHQTNYIGVDDLNSEGNYVYSSNGGAISFTLPWRSGDPDGGSIPDQDCIGIGWNNQDGWVDLPCTYQAASICERVPHGMCYSHFGNEVRNGPMSIMQPGFINDCYKVNPVGQ